MLRQVVTLSALTLALAGTAVAQPVPAPRDIPSPAATIALVTSDQERP